MDDIKSRLRKAADDFEAMRRHAANMIDSDCEPHWSEQTEMEEASITAVEAAAYIERLEVGLLKIATYPLDSGRCTDDGYPSEVVYDEYAYKRMVDSYRKAASATLKGGEND